LKECFSKSNLSIEARDLQNFRPGVAPRQGDGLPFVGALPLITSNLLAHFRVAGAGHSEHQPNGSSQFSRSHRDDDVLLLKQPVTQVHG